MHGPRLQGSPDLLYAQTQPPMSCIIVSLFQVISNLASVIIIIAAWVISNAKSQLQVECVQIFVFQTPHACFWLYITAARLIQKENSNPASVCSRIKSIELTFWNIADPSSPNPIFHVEFGSPSHHYARPCLPLKEGIETMKHYRVMSIFVN